MIYVDRNIIPFPDVFDSQEVNIAKKRLEEFYGRSKDSRSQEKYSRPFEIEIRNKILGSLCEVFNGKCAYCESLISMDASHSDYDHFRPKSGARGLEKEFSNDHYWWLTYEWCNLYYSCPVCNQYKSTWFPVEGKRAKIKTPYDKIINSENALLIDPCNDHPEDHLSYNEDGILDFQSIKGKTTIEIIKLNRTELVASRKKILQSLQNEWEVFLNLSSNDHPDMKRINKITKDWGDIFSSKSSRPYLGIQRQFLAQWLKDSQVYDYLQNRNFKVFQDSEISEGKPKIFSYEEIEKFAKKKELSIDDKDSINKEIQLSAAKHVYIESIELKNFKCFSYLKLDFNKELSIKGLEKKDSPSKSEPWLLFLGENGVGKSSLLKAIVIGLSGNGYLNELKISGKDLLKHSEKEGHIKLFLVGEERPIEVIYSEDSLASSINQPIVNFAAYNSVRLKPEKRKLLPEKEKFRGSKAKNLFDYTFSLVNAEKWLLSIKKEIFDRVALSLKDLMLLDNEDRIDRVGDNIFVKRGQETYRIEELSDGYQSLFILSVDIMTTLAGENVTFELAEGIVFIDEIGTHLHPRWRMEVVGRLRKAFPRIQFIVTTHDPLCLRGLAAGETVVLNKSTDGDIIAIADLPDPSELRIDQILTSEFFGLNSTIDPQTERLFEEYYQILALDESDRSEEQKNRLLELSELVPKIKHLGDDLREDLVYYVVDELLARKIRKDGLKIKEELKKEAIQRVESLWKIIPTKE